ncbi:MAG: ferritin family protein [Nitrospirae bacterium]|nr:ferritin family protein [Nitrospirota bacterium]
MITGKEDLLQSLIEAFLMEKGTNIFYSRAALKAENEEAKATFKNLSAWEERHMDYIQALYLAVQDERDIERFEDFSRKAEAPVTEAGIPVRDLEARVEEHSFIDDIGAVDLALQIEGKAYKLYLDLSERAADSNARVVFKEMMDQELKHVDYLKKMRLKLAETP